MSRGERFVTSGNISNSMRENYQQGIAEYYIKVKSTYRNSHFPGIRLCLFSWLNRWWQEEQHHVNENNPDVLVFDMACGSGEATLVFAEWYNAGKGLGLQIDPEIASRVRINSIRPVPLYASFPTPYVMAADPFTFDAFMDRTSYPCSDLSFSAIAEGSIPSFSINISDETVRHHTLSKTTTDDVQEDSGVNESQWSIEMVICSFALHLIETSSNLFALLWQLSLRARWLIILAPHKKPVIKDGWGWHKWDAHKWANCKMTDISGEFLHERVHCRIYRSVNI